MGFWTAVSLVSLGQEERCSWMNWGSSQWNDAAGVQRHPTARAGGVGVCCGAAAQELPALPQQQIVNMPDGRTQEP